MEPSQLSTLIKDAVSKAIPKEWLTKKELCDEFGIKPTTVHTLINDPVDPLPYSTMGEKKQLFNRNDINDFLNRRKRNCM